jgi:hypothetical protein
MKWSEGHNWRVELPPGKLISESMNSSSGSTYEFKFVVKLNQVVRKQNSDNNPLQQAFIELLPRIKDGKATIEDWLTLQTRIPTCKNEDEFKNAIHLFMDNDSVDRYNNEKLVQIKSPITKISAKNSNAKVFFFIIYF